MMINSPKVEAPIPPRRFLTILIVQILVIVVAISTFQLVQNKVVAGLWAGQAFVILGLWLFIWGVRSAQFRRTATFWLGCASLFLTALPLMITRFLNYSVAFEQVNVLGIPGPIFHHISSTIYFMMMLGTAFDLFRSFKAKKMATGNPIAN